MTKKRVWSSIPIAFSNCVKQYLLIFVKQYPLDLVKQYPKAISKRPKIQWSKSGQNSRFLKVLHRGCTGGGQGLCSGAQGVHRERTVPVFPNFFAFQAREMRFGEQNWIKWVSHGVAQSTMWHRGSAQGGTMHVFPNFFAFQARNEIWRAEVFEHFMYPGLWSVVKRTHFSFLSTF